MASSPMRAPAAGQQQSRLLEMQKKFQQKHLATLAAVKGTSPTSQTLPTTTTVITTIGNEQPVAPVRRQVGAGVGVQQQQRRLAGSGSGTGSGDDPADSMLQVDVKGKSPQHPATRINSKTATLVKKPLAAVNGNGPRAGFGRGAAAAKRTGNNAAANTAAANANAGKAFGTLNNSNSRLLLPPVVQSTVINALATGATGSAALASAATAAASGPQRPLVRAAAKVSSSSTAPGGQQRQKPSGAVSPHRWVPQSKAAVSKRPTVPPRRAAPAAAPVAAPRVQSAKSQLSADRGPPADGMARCPLCARDFAADRLPKHEEVCRRTRERDRKRKVFDASRKRLEAVAAEAGVDVASFKKKGQKEDQRAAEKLQKKKDAWRRKHDQLVRNVRNARAVQRHLAAGGTVRDLPPELENTADDRDDEADSDLVKCPHCGRTFNETAADRHVPLCADRQRNAAARMQNKRR